MTPQQKDDKNSYSEVLTGTAVFGGVKVFQIIIAIIQSKLIAVLIGPIGIGIIGLLSSSIGMIQKFTSFGLETSAVKDVSVAFAAKDNDKISKTVNAFRSMVWLTGFLGMVLTLALSPYLSKWAFGDYSYTGAFMLVAITLLLNQLKIGQVVILRGTRRIKDMALASLLGSLVTLPVIIPLYYFFKQDGIVPALISASLISLIIMFFFSRRVGFLKIKLSLKETFFIAREMLRMGFFLSLTGTIALIGVYLTRVFISQYGSITDVGLFVAGVTIINTYVGLVFSAMGTDYFPRLSGVADNKEKFSQAINHQALVTILLLGPIMAIFLVSLKWGILILYTKEFLPIYIMLFWMSLGTYLKAACWPLGFSILAKGDSRLFFYKESFIHILLLGLTIIGFHYKGLEGAGMAYLVTYIANLSLLLLIVSRFYNFKYSREYLRAFAIQFALGIAIFLLLRNGPQTTHLILGED